MVSQESKAALNWTANTRESFKTQNCFYLLSPPLYNLRGTFFFQPGIIHIRSSCDHELLDMLMHKKTGHFLTLSYKYSFYMYMYDTT